MNLALWNALTDREQSELQCSCNTAITDQMVRDKISVRPERTPEWLRKTIDQLLIEVQWHNDEQKAFHAAGNAYMANYHGLQARTKLDEVDALDAERARKLGLTEEPVRRAAE